MMSFGWRIPPSCYRRVGAECPDSSWFYWLLLASGLLGLATRRKEKR